MGRAIVSRLLSATHRLSYGVTGCVSFACRRLLGGDRPGVAVHGTAAVVPARVALDAGLRRCCSASAWSAAVGAARSWSRSSRIRERRAPRFALRWSRWCSAGAYMGVLSTPYARGQRRRARALRRVRVNRGAVLSGLAAGRATARSIVILPILCGFIGRHARRVAAVVHSVSRRRSARRVPQSRRDGVRAAVWFALQPPPSFSCAAGADAWSPHRHGDGGSGAGLRALSSAWCISATCSTSTAIGRFYVAPHGGRARTPCSAIAPRDGRRRRRSTFGGCRGKISISMRGCGTCASAIGDGTLEITEAWHENLILERFFAPVLDRPTYVSLNGNRWPPEQRADAAARGAADPPFVSAGRAVSDPGVVETAVWVDRRDARHCCARRFLFYFAGASGRR